MCCRGSTLGLLFVTVAGIGAVAGSVALTQPAKDKMPVNAKPAGQPAGQPEHMLPPGWTEADMQACMDAGTPGKMHQHLAKSAGVWAGKNTMWMAPNTEPMKSDSTSTITPMMDGRYFKCEMAGEMPGMGPFNGFGISAFDNVAQKFQSTWIDNMSTGIMFGTGELSADGKVMTWTFNYNCPITKKATTMREVDTMTGPNTFTLEMYGNDPKTGKEFKMMEIAFTRKASSPTTGTR